MQKKKWLSIFSIMALILSLLPVYAPQAQAGAGPTMPDYLLNDWQEADNFTDNFASIANNNGNISVAIKSGQSSYDADIYMSKDGEKWTVTKSFTASLEDEAYSLTKVYYAKQLQKFIVIGKHFSYDEDTEEEIEELLIYASSDGQTWEPLASDILEAVTENHKILNDVTEMSDGTIVAVGSYTDEYYNDNGFILWSKDGGNWNYKRNLNDSNSNQNYSSNQNFTPQVVTSFMDGEIEKLYIGAANQYANVTLTAEGAEVSIKTLTRPAESTLASLKDGYLIEQTSVMNQDGVGLILTGSYVGTLPDGTTRLDERPLLMVSNNGGVTWSYKTGLSKELGLVSGEDADEKINPDYMFVVKKVINPTPAGLAVLIEQYDNTNGAKSKLFLISSNDLNSDGAWMPALNPIPSRDTVNDVAIHNGKLIFAGNTENDAGGVFDHSVVHSIDVAEDNAQLKRNYDFAKYNDALFADIPNKRYGMYVAVGDNGLIAIRSYYDGSEEIDDWKPVASGVGVDVNFTRIIHQDGTFIAIGKDTSKGDAPVAVSSTNGYEWTSYNGNIPPVTNPLTGITGVADYAVNDGKYVVVKTDGTVHISSDNQNWTPVTVDSSKSTIQFKTVVVGAGNFVVGGENGALYASADNGTTWSSAIATPITKTITSLVYGGIGFVALADAEQIAYVQEKFTLTYDQNGGTGYLPEPVTGKEVNVEAPPLSGESALVKDGHHFAGWNTKADGTGEFYLLNESLSLTTNLTLYAQWLPVLAGEKKQEGDLTFEDIKVIAVADDGTIYFSAPEFEKWGGGNNPAYNKVYKIKNNEISVVAGTGEVGFDDDNSRKATESKLNYPMGLALDAEGNLYIADSNNHRIRKVDNEGNITTVVGGGAISGEEEEGPLNIGDGGPAISAILDKPTSIAFDNEGNMYIADMGHDIIRKVKKEGSSFTTIETIAGTPNINGFDGDGNLATNAKLQSPYGVAVDSQGNVYIADTDNTRIRKIGVDKKINTVVENAFPSYVANLQSPSYSIVIDGNDNVYFMDYFNSRVNKLDAEGNVSTVTTVGGKNPVIVALKGTDKLVISGSTWDTGVNKNVSYLYDAKIPTKSTDNDDENDDNNNNDDGGGGTSTPPTNNTSVDVIVNGKVESIGQATTTTVNHQTQLTLTVDEAKLQEKLDKEGNNATVIIPVTNTKADVIVGQLNGQMVKNMEDKQATVVVQTPTASYTLPANQINIDAISKQIGENASLKDIQINIEIATPQADTVKVVEDAAKKGNFILQVPPVDFKVTYTSGDKTGEVLRFNAYVERTIAIPDGVDPSKITTGIVVNPDGTTYHVPTKVIQKDGKYYAVINSLTNSTYSVIWNQKEFSDVANNWAKDSIINLGSRMVVNGDNGFYHPNRDISRAEFAAIMVRGLGLKPGVGESKYSDVASDAWYTDYIKTATDYKLINGYENGQFGPNDKITRQQAFAIIARAMSLTELSVDLSEAEVNTILAKFSDASKIAGYAKENVALAVKKGVVNGRSNQIAPNDYITRAEVAAIVERLLKKSELINQ